MRRKKNVEWGMKSPVNTRAKGFHGYLSHTRLPAFLDGGKTFLDCYIHDSNNHTSIYVTEAVAKEVANVYCRNSKITMIWDDAEAGYWSNAQRKGNPVIDDQRALIPYRCYKYKVKEDDGTMQVKRLFCITQIVIALNILAKGVNAGER